ncbi:MAG: hypothetical protein ISR91_07890, partial [Candidatus Delongbacteria bacterium]|nr:hypothetical protein [Candidatus Delongbacteria bacterium]
MRKFNLLSLILLLCALPLPATTVDDDLVTRTATWNADHPNSLPHWMTPEE